MSDKVAVPERHTEWYEEVCRAAAEPELYTLRPARICTVLEELGRAEAEVATLRAENERWIEVARELFHSYGGGLLYGRTREIAMMLDSYDTSRTGEKEAKG